MTASIIRADARRLPLPDESVDLIVTSPPYWGLRSYTDGGRHYDGQVGAEPTPQEYIAVLLDCTREWARVLKPSGSMFVLLGDKYANRTRGAWRGSSDGYTWRAASPRYVRPKDMPEKSLMLLPERYRIGAVDDLGLIARAVVIWDKPSAMPESVTDRVRRSHEDWVHLTKEPYYFSAVDEIRKPHAAPRRRAGRSAFNARNVNHVRTGTGDYHGQHPLGALPGSVWEVATQPLRVPEHLDTEHFAAFPPALIQSIVLGWSPSGICAACGEGRRPVVDKPGLLGGDNNPDSRNGSRRRSTMDGGRDEWAARIAKPDRIVGYACACPESTAPTCPAVVLDPFGGTGTTALVADVYGRHGISVDLSHDYGRLARWRTTDPGERARALGVPKPPPVPDGQDSLFEEIA
ncbi:site-specific DNA-methyltransferase [Actinomadura sp. NPDC049382]|uniref:DNA-methyltransferase n=1 Tax=Actinomadura sp. NPDC049382 TaxID=3158220 RepID=UPI00343929C6